MDMEGNMKIAVLSGKGGTGKTLVSVNLAATAQSATYIDCDVEEPNCHLFLKPNNCTIQGVNITVPVVDENLCNGCRKCVDFCKFNALAYTNNKVMVFNEICHSCGGCKILCPTGAITEKEKCIGQISNGHSEEVNVFSGFLNTGETSGVPIIKKLLEDGCQKEGIVFIDCPPGSACTAMESISDSDYCILVAEPTIFGAHNLKMVYELVKLFNKPFGAVLNKCTIIDNPSEQFCNDHDIKILGSIPFEKELGELNSNGYIAVRKNKNYNMLFKNILDTLIEEVKHETVVNP